MYMYINTLNVLNMVPVSIYTLYPRCQHGSRIQRIQRVKFVLVYEASVLFSKWTNIIIKIIAYMTGKTLGKTIAPSARYWYRILVSDSSVLYLTSVAKTVSTKACVVKSVNTSGSNKILFSLLTDTLALRF